MAAGILGYAALVILYSLLAATILETLLRMWRVKDPPLAVSFRLQVLAIPPLAPLLFAILTQEAGAESLRRQAALFDLRNWLGPEFGLSHPGWVLLLATMAGAALLLVGLEFRVLLRRRPAGRLAHLSSGRLPGKLQAAVVRLSVRERSIPPVLAVDHPEPMAWTVGLRQPMVLITTSLVGMLDERELEGVLAHEVAHVRRRDNWLGWLVFILRLISFYNPVALFAFHQISHDMERVCDREAVATTEEPLALASALIKVCRATLGKRTPGESWFGRLGGHATALENRARQTLVVDRVERLIHPEKVGATRHPRLRLGLAVTAVVAVSYLAI